MSVPICIGRRPVLHVRMERNDSQRWGLANASATPRGTCFLCALLHLPIFSNGAQQGRMNRPASDSATVKLHRGSSVCTDLSLHKYNPVGLFFYDIKNMQKLCRYKCRNKQSRRCKRNPQISNQLKC